MMIDRLFNGFEGKLTSSKWAQLAKCSQDAALRGIDDLVAKGVLTRDTPGGRSTSYSLVGQESDKDRSLQFPTAIRIQTQGRPSPGGGRKLP
jgi:hypothetical protein